jgi:hypothetical protein
MQIDSIIAQAGLSPISAPAPAPSASSKHARREKIYCDKWIHEGVCAFTQLGCKYKHEMPMDKATQLSLGLNHGLPLWYKRAQAVQMRAEPQQQQQLAISPSPSPRVAGPWRRADAAAAAPAAVGQSLPTIMSSPQSKQASPRPPSYSHITASLANPTSPSWPFSLRSHRSSYTACQKQPTIYKPLLSPQI